MRPLLEAYQEITNEFVHRIVANFSLFCGYDHVWKGLGSGHLRLRARKLWWRNATDAPTCSAGLAMWGRGIKWGVRGWRRWCSRQAPGYKKAKARSGCVIGVIGVRTRRYGGWVQGRSGEDLIFRGEEYEEGDDEGRGLSI